MSDVSPKAHLICDLLQKHGCTIGLNNRAFADLCRLLYDLFPVDELQQDLDCGGGVSGCQNMRRKCAHCIESDLKAEADAIRTMNNHADYPKQEQINRYFDDDPIGEAPMSNVAKTPVMLSKASIDFLRTLLDKAAEDYPNAILDIDIIRTTIDGCDPSGNGGGA